MSERNEEFPSGWVSVPFGELCTFAQNGCGTRRSAAGLLTVVLRLADVSTDGRIASKNLREIKLSEQDRQKYALKCGDLLAYRVNGSPRIAGQVIHYPGPDGYAFCDHFIRFRTDNTALDPEFASLAFRVAAVRQLIEARMVSSAGQNTVSQSSFAEISFPLPPLTEQRRIVVKIEALQERSRRAREALAEMGPLLEQFRQSVLAAAFRGDLTADWRAAHPNLEPASELLHRIRAERRHRWEQAELTKYEAKGQKPPKNWQNKYEEPEPVDDSNLAELPEGWCWAGLEELKDLSSNSMTDGPFGSRLKTAHYSSSGIRVVRLGNIGIGHFNADDEAFIPRSRYEELQKYEIFAGDLVIAALAEPVGRCCKIPPSIGKAIVKADCIRFRPHPSVLPEIIMHWLNSGTGRRLAEMASHGIGRLRINMENLRSLPVALPPVDEQIEIVASMAEQLAGIARIEEQVSSGDKDLTQLDQAILAKAFRGELVPQDPNDEPASVLLARIRQQRTQQAEVAKRNKNISMTQRGNKTGKKSPRLTPQQLTLAEMLLTKK